MIAQQTRSVLVCDGCGGQVVGAAGQNALELRGEMYGDGWRYPSKVARDGRPVSRSHSDVCPLCIGDWTAAPYRDARHEAAS